MIKPGKSLDRKEGRQAFPKKFKLALLQRDGEYCALCHGAFPAGVLQIDHKTPYEVLGDIKGELEIEDFMLLCSSCNRSKSWICEHCTNWQQIKDPSICKKCLLGSPTIYEHIAMEQIRSLTLTWNGNEVQDYERLQKEAKGVGKSLNEYIKGLLKSLE